MSSVADMPSERQSSGIASATVIRVTLEHDVARACQEALCLAAQTGFTSVACHYLATSVSELARNLVFHALEGGSITILPISGDGISGVEVIAEDQGPGIVDVPRAMEDGYSTRGGLGGGLPAVRRLMDEFVISSAAGTGTRIVTRMWRR